MTQKSVEITRKGAQHSFSHPDCDRRYRNFTGSALLRAAFADYTAGGELHPAPKIPVKFYFVAIIRLYI